MEESLKTISSRIYNISISQNILDKTAVFWDLGLMLIASGVFVIHRKEITDEPFPPDFDTLGKTKKIIEKYFRGISPKDLSSKKIIPYIKNKISKPKPEVEITAELAKRVISEMVSETIERIDELKIISKRGYNTNKLKSAHIEKQTVFRTLSEMCFEMAIAYESLGTVFGYYYIHTAHEVELISNSYFDIDKTLSDIPIFPIEKEDYEYYFEKINSIRMCLKHVLDLHRSATKQIFYDFNLSDIGRIWNDLDRVATEVINKSNMAMGYWSAKIEVCRTNKNNTIKKTKDKLINEEIIKDFLKDIDLNTIDKRTRRKLVRKAGDLIDREERTVKELFKKVMSENEK